MYGIYLTCYTNKFESLLCLISGTFQGSNPNWQAKFQAQGCHNASHYRKDKIKWQIVTYLTRFASYRECFCKNNCWQELHFEFSRQNLKRSVQSPSMWWWLITQPKPIWKKAPPGLQKPSRTDLLHIGGLVLTQPISSTPLTWPQPPNPLE